MSLQFDGETLFSVKNVNYSNSYLVLRTHFKENLIKVRRLDCVIRSDLGSEFY